MLNARVPPLPDYSEKQTEANAPKLVMLGDEGYTRLVTALRARDERKQEGRHGASSLLCRH